MRTSLLVFCILTLQIGILTVNTLWFGTIAFDLFFLLILACYSPRLISLKTVIFTFFFRQRMQACVILRLICDASFVFLPDVDVVGDIGVCVSM